MMQVNDINIARNAFSQESLQQQRLPNECLILVIQQLGHDLSVLCKFLTVNHLFFKESLKLMLGRPFSKWLFLPYWNRRTKRLAAEPLVALFLRSALQREWLQRQGQQRQGRQKDGEEDSVQNSTASVPSWSQTKQSHSELDSIMEKYGLALSYSFIHSMESYSQLTTVDYSVYLSSLSSKNIDSLELGLIVQLQKSENPGSIMNNDETVEDQMDSQSSRTAGGLMRFLLQHSCGHITDLGFKLHESAQYVGFAIMMPNLRTLEIGLSMPSYDRPSFTIDAARFIRLNQEASPFKPPLDLRFYQVTPHHPLFGNALAGRGQQAWLEARQRWKARYNPIPVLYEAVGRPRSMDASVLPWFYEDSLSIETGDLETFMDHNYDRWQAGEGPAMERFLRQCPELQSLDLTVREPPLFRWFYSISVTMDQTRKSLVTAQSGRPLSKLSILKLNTECIYWILLQALNDVVVGVGKSLESILVSQTPPGIFHQVHNSAADLLGDSPEIQGIPRATTIGIDWYLPRVRKIVILFEGTVSIGSFDQCPLLEKLWISNGRIYPPPLREVDSIEALQQTAFLESLTLLPVWRLPRLKRLRLSGMVAVQFNFESIRFMASLQNLTLEVGIRGWFPCFANMYMRQCPTLIQTILPSDTPPVQDPTSRFYPWHWSSDSLICVSIAGPAAMMFHLEQLARFPSLENLDLKAITVNRYSLLKTQEEALTKLYSFQTLVPHEASLNLDPIQDLRSSIFSAGSLPVQTEHVADKALIDPSRIQVPEDSLLRGSSKIPATPPLLHSGSGKLRCLGLLGVWESVDPAIWTRILTRFAPHLCELRGFDDLDVFTQIQNIEKAFKAMEEMKNDQGLTREATEEANNEPCWGSRYYQTNRPRKRGLFVELAFGILSESDQEKLGLIEIEKEEKEDYMTRPASRVYELVQTQSYFVLERIQSGTNQDSY